MGTMQNIAFDNIISNLGNAYNPHAGVFIAPVSGIYLFSTSLLTYPETSAHFQIVKNGTVVTKAYLQANSASRETGAMTVVLQLARGDDVSVVNVDIDNSVNGYHYSFFTGVLLQELLDDVTSVVGK